MSKRRTLDPSQISIAVMILVVAWGPFTLRQETASAKSGRDEIVIGEFTPKRLSHLKIGCQDRAIKAVSLVAQRPSSCSGELHIQTVAIAYPNLNQIFDYPNENGEKGSILTRASFQLLPGTKCLNDLSAQISVHGEIDSRCRDQHKIQVVITQ